MHSYVHYLNIWNIETDFLKSAFTGNLKLVFHEIVHINKSLKDQES